MSEKIYACLRRLYPANFRQAHGDDALQLFRVRLRDETGFFRRTRLWFDIFVDLAISLPHLYTTSQPELAEASVPHSAGAPRFFVLQVYLRSTAATRLPSPANVHAAIVDPVPPPRITRSNSSSCVSMRIFLSERQVHSWLA